MKEVKEVPKSHDDEVDYDLMDMLGDTPTENVLVQVDPWFGRWVAQVAVPVWSGCVTQVSSSSSA
eukprot:5362911-Amphidinium_carterae.3